jgi:hypothetical protein
VICNQSLKMACSARGGSLRYLIAEGCRHRGSEGGDSRHRSGKLDAGVDVVRRRGERALRSVLGFLDEDVATMKPKRLDYWRAYLGAIVAGDAGDTFTVAPSEET